MQHDFQSTLKCNIVCEEVHEVVVLLIGGHKFWEFAMCFGDPIVKILKMKDVLKAL